ncbi:unnamed protein product [Somion occarium]|uniref:RING-type domain-containing protein n=1 Tax=Somion occarium TaxID=3059160 RepID=A0ABP1DIB2_9APHY
METVSFAPDELAVRRVRSTGDIPGDTDMPTRPPRSRMAPTQRRSEGQSPRTAAYTREQLYAPSGRRSAPLPALDRPDLGGHDHPLTWNAMPQPTVPVEPRPSVVPPRPQAEHTGWVGILMSFLGYAGPNARARRELLSLIWSLFFNLAQFVVVVTLLAYSSHHRSPTEPDLTEWDACDKPLGAWNAIWVVRVTFGATVAYWSWQRDRIVRLAQEQRDHEADPGRPDTLRPVNFGNSPRTSPSFTNNRYGTTQDVRLTHIESVNQLPYSSLYNRLSVTTSLLSMVWFLTAHILAYTSVNTCRRSSPHIWYLTLGILCILYLMVLEIFILGLLVFILGPVVYLAWNLILLCLGRHPLQNPHYIKPEIGKLPKSVVDQIPLVLYIPHPPEDQEPSPDKKSIAFPPAAYSYPPKPPAPTVPRKRRFAFLRRSKKDTTGESTKEGTNGTKMDKGKSKAPASDDQPKTWEDHWEPGEYPFVRLEGNRAACAICLMDFEEPKRKHGGDEAKDERPQDAVAEGGDSGAIQEVQVEEITQEDVDRLRLDHAGDGPQPLRLLACGHVFHKTCLDPWLTDVSGRCPVCQRPVEIPKPSGKKKRRSNDRTDSNSPQDPPS